MSNFVSGGDAGAEPAGDGGADRVLSMWTIYDRPADFPNDYVARRWEIRGKAWGPTADHIVCDDLWLLRDQLQELGLTQMPRMEEDEAHIVETWL